MLGRKTFTPHRIHPVSREDRVPADHLLRRIATAVDFSFVRRLTARYYSTIGQPGIDPVVLFTMALIGYLSGITSERRLAEELRLHLGYMWFIGYDLDERPPDHSVLSKARRRFGVTIYQAFFTEVVRQCVQAGLIAGDRLFADSTLVEANASRESVGSRALRDQLCDVDEHVAALWRDNPSDPEPEPREPTLREAPYSEAAQTAAVAAAVPDASASAIDPPAAMAASSPPSPPPGPHPVGPADPPNGPQGRTNDLVRSRTDPDAGLVSRDGVPLDLYYKVHGGVDGGRARIITARDVTPGDIADEFLLDRLRKEHEGTTGCAVREVVADAKYGTHDNDQTLEAAGIKASIPPHLASDQHRPMPREQFTYDPVHGSVCLSQRPTLDAPGDLPYGQRGGVHHLSGLAQGVRSLSAPGGLLRYRPSTDHVPSR